MKKIIILTILVLTTAANASDRGRLEGFIGEMQRFQVANKANIDTLAAKVKELDDLKANLARQKQFEIELAKHSAELTKENESLKASSNIFEKLALVITALGDIVTKLNTSNGNIDKTAERLEKAERNLNKLLDIADEVMGHAPQVERLK